MPARGTNPEPSAHTCSFDLSLQTMMSSQVGPGTPGYGADKPFNSRCHLASAGLGPELEARIFRDRFRFDDGGARRDRTDDLMLAKHALYQLSYGPLEGFVIDPALSARGVTRSVVGPGGLEPPTSRLSGVCSNQLSYRPLKRSAQTPGASHKATASQRLNARSHHSLYQSGCSVYGKRNEDGGDPHLIGVLWRINRPA